MYDSFSDSRNAWITIAPYECNYFHPYREFDEDCLRIEIDSDSLYPGYYDSDDWDDDGGLGPAFEVKITWWDSSAPEIVDRPFYIAHRIQDESELDGT